MKFIENVSIDEVIFSLLKGHHGQEVKEQNINLLKHNPSLILNPDFNSFEENMIRRGALSLCAGSTCPLISLILRSSPKSKWNEPLEFCRVKISKKEFLNFKEVNKKLTLRKAVKNNRYKENKKVNQIKKLIKEKKFKKEDLNRIIFCKIDTNDFIIDGTHRALALASLIIYDNFTFLDNIELITLIQPLYTKKKFFIFKKFTELFLNSKVPLNRWSRK